MHGANKLRGVYVQLNEKERQRERLQESERDKETVPKEDGKKQNHSRPCQTHLQTQRGNVKLKGNRERERKRKKERKKKKESEGDRVLLLVRESYTLWYVMYVACALP